MNEEKGIRVQRWLLLPGRLFARAAMAQSASEGSEAPKADSERLVMAPPRVFGLAVTSYFD